MTECVRHTGLRLWQEAVSRLFRSYIPAIPQTDYRIVWRRLHGILSVWNQLFQSILILYLGEFHAADYIDFLYFHWQAGKRHFPVIDETDSVSFTIGHLAAIIYGNRWNLIRRTDSRWIGSSCDHCYGVGRVWTDEEAGKGIEVE